MDIRFLNAKIPSLSIESSFGRSFPRFYVRGLGNTDFDLNASQPVSLVVDEVVQENAILKGFPVFDVERVEVLRGPQGTLFGRNTPAGLVKFDTVKPSQEFDGYGSVYLLVFHYYGKTKTITLITKLQALKLKMSKVVTLKKRHAFSFYMKAMILLLY